MVASGLPSLSFFRWWFSFSSPPPHFCADQTQRHSDLKKREGRVASHMTYGRSLQPRFPEIPSGYTQDVFRWPDIHTDTVALPSPDFARASYAGYFSQEEKDGWTVGWRELQKGRGIWKGCLGIEIVRDNLLKKGKKKKRNGKKKKRKRKNPRGRESYTRENFEFLR